MQHLRFTSNAVNISLKIPKQTSWRSAESLVWGLLFFSVLMTGFMPRWCKDRLRKTTKRGLSRLANIHVLPGRLMVI